MKLALVPTADVPDVFIHLVETILDTVQIDPLLGYFESREDLDCWTEWMSCLQQLLRVTSPYTL